MKPTTEQLDFDIYDLGLNRALQKYNLTIEQAEKILFKAPIKLKNERKPKKCYILPEVNKDKIQPLYQAVNKNYNELKKKFLSSSDLLKITKHSNNKEDSFHSAILKLFEESSDFEYISDEKTLSYIKRHLFYSKKAEERDLFRDKTEFEELPLDGLY